MRRTAYQIISFFFIFLVFFSFFYFLTSNLPFSLHDSADLYWINLANNKGWGATFINFITKDNEPLPHGGTALTRPIQVFFTKILFSFFGDNPYPFYLSRAIMFAFVAVLIFWLAGKSIYCNSLRFLATFFYMTLPPIFISSVWIGDISILSQLFLLASFLFYLKLIFSEKISGISSFILQFATIFLFFISLRTKENCVVFVPIIILFTLILNRQKFKEYKLFFLFLLLITFYFMLPSLGGGDAPVVSGKTIFDKLYEIIIQNHVYSTSGMNFLDVKEDIALFSPFSPIKTMPGSLISLLGFFLSWLTIFLFISIGFIEKWFFHSFRKLLRLISTPLTESKFRHTSNIYLIFFGIWLISELALFFKIGSEARYLINGGALPLIFLVFIMLDKFLFWFKGGLKKIVFVFIFILILVYIIVNTYNISVPLMEKLYIINVIDNAVNIVMDHEIKEAYFSENRLTALYQLYEVIPYPLRLQNIFLNKDIPFWKIQNGPIMIPFILVQHPRVYILSSEKIDIMDIPVIGLMNMSFINVTFLPLELCPKGLYCKIKQKLNPNNEPYSFLYILQNTIYEKEIN